VLDSDLGFMSFVVCDPVMGDSGELYRSVPKEMVQRYKEQVFPYADVLFPNQTECECVSSREYCAVFVR
jgi:pyridoxine kinase